jgi:Mg2+ and Co2+ transporter CorA
VGLRQAQFGPVLPVVAPHSLDSEQVAERREALHAFVTAAWHHTAFGQPGEGADADQLRCLRKGSKLADIPVADISEYIARPGCFVWVALSDATAAELDEMREEFDLHELAVEDARNGHQRPKIEEYGQSLFAVMQLLEPDPDRPGHFNQGEVDVFVGPNYVLSVRNRSTQGFLGCEAAARESPSC